MVAEIMTVHANVLLVERPDRWNLECDENGEVRTRIYYCDPNRSDQKGALEKNHEYRNYVLGTVCFFYDFFKQAHWTCFHVTTLSTSKASTSKISILLYHTNFLILLQ